MVVAMHLLAMDPARPPENADLREQRCHKCSLVSRCVNFLPKQVALCPQIFDNVLQGSESPELKALPEVKSSVG